MRRVPPIAWGTATPLTSIGNTKVSSVSHPCVMCNACGKWHCLNLPDEKDESIRRFFLTQQTTASERLIVLVSFSPSAHLEKLKRIIRERKSYANDARNTCYFAAGEQKKHGPELALKSCYLYRTLYPTVRKTLKGLQTMLSCHAPLFPCMSSLLQTCFVARYCLPEGVRQGVFEQGLTCLVTSSSPARRRSDQQREQPSGCPRRSHDKLQ